MQLRRRFALIREIRSNFMEIPLAVTLGTCLFVIACWITDLRSRTIPNLLPAAGLVAGIAVNYWWMGGLGVFKSTMGAAMAGGVLLAPFALGGIGGGDVKMMGAVGAWLGPKLALAGLVLGLVIGGVLMVAHLARAGRLSEKLAATGDMFRRAVRERSLAPLRISDESADAVTLPYSVPLGIGTLVVLGYVMTVTGRQ